MNKQDIISRLKDFPYSREEYWVITGSAMVLYGIREQTHDIDMGCTSQTRLMAQRQVLLLIPLLRQQRLMVLMFTTT